MSLLTRTDVTSVKLYDNFILAGLGSYMHVYEKNSSKLIQRLHVLKGQKIYGIVPLKKESKILVYGGKQFTIIAVNKEDIKFTCCFTSIICDDWLHSGIWTSNDKISLLTAHNVVQIWNTKTRSLETQYKNRNNSILYSGLLLPLNDGVLVFSGTVFSQVLISYQDEEPMHYLRGHKGVIFSISCDPKKGIIVTTSDDRSVHIWSIKNKTTHTFDTKAFWENVHIHPLHELYGHGARVMRNCIVNDIVISVGEDSAICYWDLEGNLVKKSPAHANACIWSLDANEEHLVTGGADSAVILHPLSILSEHNKNSDTLNVDIDTPKKIVFTARRNVIAMNENNDLVYYDVDSKSSTAFKLKHESTYKLISVSSCRQLIAVADMTGKFDVFIENCKGPPMISNIIDTELDMGKILSMHWILNRHVVFCADLGKITVLTTSGNKLDVFAEFELPFCKERWITSCALSSDNLIVGDRLGNIHVFVRGQKSPVRTFKRVHGRYGPTSINVRQNEFISTGRDGTMKYFNLSALSHNYNRDLDFQWVEKFVDSNDRYICGFQERIFVVYDVKNNVRALEVTCGGGHRSWDVLRYIEKEGENFDEFISFIYIKEANIHLERFNLKNIVSKNIVNGTHSKEINCLVTHKFDDTLFYISGGEDTTLRVSSSNSALEFKDELILKHLSNVRALKINKLDDRTLLVTSAGGRAQICVNKIIFDKVDGEIKVTTEELANHMINGTDVERRYNKMFRNEEIDFDPETRIMALENYSKDDNTYVIFAGCSDGNLRVFQLELNTKSFCKINDIFYHSTCILNTQVVDVGNTKILLSSSTEREISFWNTLTLVDRPISTLMTHQSGINGIYAKALSDTELLLASGGDDNAVELAYFKVMSDRTKSICYWSNSSSHCSQVTGVIIIDNLLLSTSIDQRVTVFEWSIVDDQIKCDFKSQVFSDVADIQGMDLVGSDEHTITLCIYGKGIELMEIPRPRN
ncbi:unnamed protein product [Colias eurytheme]|nr:unnamed protein product [Colias eurytheme]